MPQNTETEDKGLFDDMLDEYDDLDDGGVDDDELKGDESGNTQALDANQKKQKKLKETERLKKQNADLQEYNRQMAERVKTLEEKTKTVDKLKNVFGLEEKEGVEKNDEIVERDEFDKDPFAYNQEKLSRFKKNLEENFKKEIDDKVIPIQANMTVERCKDYINKKYKVDWAKKGVEDKVAEKLKRLTVDYRKEQPLKAMIMAAYWTGELKLKHNPKNLSHYEEGEGTSYYGSPYADDKEAKRIKEGIKRENSKKLFNI